MGGSTEAQCETTGLRQTSMFSLMTGLCLIAIHYRGTEHLCFREGESASYIIHNSVMRSEIETVNNDGKTMTCLFI